MQEIKVSYQGTEFSLYELPIEALENWVEKLNKAQLRKVCFSYEPKVRELMKKYSYEQIEKYADELLTADEIVEIQEMKRLSMVQLVGRFMKLTKDELKRVIIVSAKMYKKLEEEQRCE